MTLETKTQNTIHVVAGRLLLVALLFAVSPVASRIMGVYVSPTITVVSPTAGSSLAKGQSYEITWDSSNVAQVYVQLYKGGALYPGESGSVSRAIMNSGSYIWTVPGDLPEDDDYSVRVLYNNSDGVFDDSGLFSIDYPLPRLPGAGPAAGAVTKPAATDAPPPAGPALTISLDEKNPASRLAVFGSTGVVLAEVRLSAISERVEITQLKVSIEDGGTPATAKGDYKQVRKFHLKKDGEVFGSVDGYAPAAESTKINFLQSQFVVPEGDGVRVSIIADLSDLGPGEPGQANADIRAGLGGAASITAVGQVSGSAITKQYNASTGTAVILRKAIPAVVIEAPANRLGAVAVLHRAKVSAIGRTGIGLYRLSYAISTTTGVKVSGLFTRLISCTGCPEVPAQSQLSGIAPDLLYAGSTLDDGLSIVSLPVDRGQPHKKAHLQISAGATAVIDLYGRVRLTEKIDTVSVRMLSDTANAAPSAEGGPADFYKMLEQGNFVWSDLHLDRENAPSANAAWQWYNGYLVPGLSRSSITTPHVTVGE